MGRNGAVEKGEKTVKFEKTRLVYEGTPDEYTKYIRQVFLCFAIHFENVWKGLGHLKKTRVSNSKWHISLGGYGIIHAGDALKHHIYPLIFKYNSVLTLAQSITYDREESV